MKNNTLALFYKNEEVVYPGYSALALSNMQFTRQYRGTIKNKVDLLFPTYCTIGGSCLIDEVRLKDFFGREYYDTFTTVEISLGVSPVFRKGKLTLTLQ